MRLRGEDGAPYISEFYEPLGIRIEIESLTAFDFVERNIGAF
jgi:hypothetical protein